MSIILQAEKLYKEYKTSSGAVNALNGVDLSIEKGLFYAIIGRSGSGKSTLLHVLSGLDRPTSGKVLIDGVDMFSFSDEKMAIFRRRSMGFVFQQFNLLRSQNQIDSFRIQNITLHIFDHITRQLIETHLDQTILYFFSTIMFHQFSGI